MDYSGLQRLAEEQQKALHDTDKELKKWAKFKEDYLTLQSKIQSLPDHVTYDYMVPFGPLAFMPGQLIHTNEILVLLGDNWFAEMSAKQSCEVIDRRLADIEKSISSFNDQKRLLETRTDFTKQEFSPLEVDITEAYDSDEDRRWRASHKKSLRKERLQKSSALHTSHTDEDVINKLELLQLQEMRGKEMSKLDEKALQQNTETENVWSQNANKKAVHWENTEKTDTSLDLPDDSSPEGSDSSSSMDSDDSEVNHTSVIQFKHSPRSDVEDANTYSDNTADGGIVSPADIYKEYCKPKSILKPSQGLFEQVKSTAISKRTLPEHLEGSPHHHSQQIDAVQQHVIEKNPKEVLPSAPQPTPQQSQEGGKSPAATQSEGRPPARVSKFKAMRQKRAT